MRRFPPLLAAAIVLAGCGGSTPDRSGRDVDLALGGRPGAVHAGLYLALQRGYDDAEGATLHPAQVGDPAQALERGQAELAVLDIHELDLARASGADVVGVMANVGRARVSRAGPGDPALDAHRRPGERPRRGGGASARLPRGLHRPGVSRAGAGDRGAEPPSRRGRRRAGSPRPRLPGQPADLRRARPGAPAGVGGLGAAHRLGRAPARPGASVRRAVREARVRRAPRRCPSLRKKGEPPPPPRWAPQVECDVARHMRGQRHIQVPATRLNTCPRSRPNRERCYACGVAAKRCASVSSSDQATCGFCRTNGLKFQVVRAARRTSVSARTVEVRGMSGTMRAISPKWSPGPRVRRSSPSTTTVAFPSRMRKNATPPLPCVTTSLPAAASRSVIVWARPARSLRETSARNGTFWSASSVTDMASDAIPLRGS